MDTILFNPATDAVELIDQTRLPLEKLIVRCTRAEEVAEAIKTMQIRGAPAIGVAAAYGVFLGLRDFSGPLSGLRTRLEQVCHLLGSTRPTAVNLFWALNRVKNALGPLVSRPECNGEELAQAALQEAEAIRTEDIEMCRAMGREGAALLHDGETWVTHCNAGALATGGYGTALGVFRAAKEAGRRFKVFVDETRPLLQGARLTAWELQQEGIDATLICDNMSGSLMAAGKIQGCVVGADRITRDGFVANKIGTYPLAVLAHYHKIPFYVAAPVSTFDLSLSHGSEIVIEERSHDEVTALGGRQVAPTGMKVFNPAFDVTPPELVTAIFTNLGTLRPPYGKSIPTLIGGVPTKKGGRK